MGSGIDRKAPDFDTLTTYNKLEPGDDVTIYKKDGSTATGTISEPLQHLSFEQKVAKITRSSSTVFNLNTGSFSNSSLPAQQAIPTSIVFRQHGNEDARIPIDSIQHIVAPHEKNAAITGLIIGGVVDVVAVAIIASIASGMNNMFGGSHLN
ncbi:MAG TPA: hypothetical protein DGH68_04785 [Bacteroidetes bacterium]|nr:hypothetical protein [Bacteroidota bacterium]